MKTKNTKKRKVQARRVAYAAAPIQSTSRRNGKKPAHVQPGNGKRAGKTAAQPRYNEGYRYDTPNLRYALTDPVTPVNDGGKVALNLKTRTDPQVLIFTDNHIALIGADPLFTTLMPSAPEFLTLRNNFATSLASFNAAKTVFHEATVVKDNARAALEVGFNVRGPFVQATTNGNTAAIMATGLPVKAGPTPPPALQPPQNLRIDLNGTPGVMFATWLAAAAARGYLIQHSLASTAERNWSEPVNSTNRKVVFNDMVIGQLYAFRVATLGSDSAQSDWSMEVLRMAA